MSKEGKPEPVEGCRRGDELIQPVNYSAVVEGQLHRSGFPNKNNFAFIRSLKLKSVVCVCHLLSNLLRDVADLFRIDRTLVPEDYPVENREFLEQEGIQFFQFGIPGNKEPFVHSMSFNSTPFRLSTHIFESIASSRRTYRGSTRYRIGRAKLSDVDSLQ